MRGTYLICDSAGWCLPEGVQNVAQAVGSESTSVPTTLVSVIDEGVNRTVVLGGPLWVFLINVRWPSILHAMYEPNPQ